MSAKTKTASIKTASIDNNKSFFEPVVLMTLGNLPPNASGALLG